MSELTFDMFCQKLKTETEELMQEEETGNLPETSNEGWDIQPRPPEVVEIPRCNNAGTEWNEMRC